MCITPLTAKPTADTPTDFIYVAQYQTKYEVTNIVR